MNLQSALAIVEETQFSEPVHEKTYPRAGGTDHLGQGLLTDLRDYSLGHALFAEVSQQKQKPS
jgi:hypothetical protein